MRGGGHVCVYVGGACVCVWMSVCFIKGYTKGKDCQSPPILRKVSIYYNYVYDGLAKINRSVCVCVWWVGYLKCVGSGHVCVCVCVCGGWDTSSVWGVGMCVCGGWDTSSVCVCVVGGIPQVCGEWACVCVWWVGYLKCVGSGHVCVVGVWWVGYLKCVGSGHVCVVCVWWVGYLKCVGSVCVCVGGIPQVCGECVCVVGGIPQVCVWWVGYLKCVGKSSLVEMTSRAFQPNIATPLNTQDKTTVTFSVEGTMRIRKALNPHTNTDRANGGRGISVRCEACEAYIL